MSPLRTASPVQSVLLACLSPQVDPSRLQDLIQSPRFDWKELYRLADRHRMVGIVAPMIHGILDGGLSEGPQSPWLSQWRTLATQDLAQMAALGEILAVSQGRGLRPMLLKGLAVHLQAYPQETARGAGDIDLLVKSSEAPAMVGCLETLGFTFQGKDSRGRPLPNWSLLLKRTNEAPFSRSIGGVTIDIHWSLCAPIEEYVTGLSLSHQMWNETRQISLGQTACTIPGREEEVLLLCLHLLKGGPFHLRGLCDLVRMMEVPASGIRWDRLLELAQSTGTAGVAYYGFELATQISPSLVPDSVRLTLRRSSGPRWLLGPSVRLDCLLKTQGEGLTNLGLRWRGIFFTRHPWLWVPYQTVLHGKRALRQFLAVLR